MSAFFWIHMSLIKFPSEEEASLLRRLQTQTLPDEAPPIGKIHPFSNIAASFEPVIQFIQDYSGFRISLSIVT